MGVVVVVALVVVPLAEIWTIIQVAHVIGGWPTVLLLLVESLLGAVLLRRQGRRTWSAFRSALDERRQPAREVTDGALVLVGGVLLLTPGFLTDVAGFLLLAPPTRALVRRRLTRSVARRLVGPIGPGARSSSPRSNGRGRTTTRPPRGEGRVVDGQVVDRHPPVDGGSGPT